MVVVVGRTTVRVTVMSVKLHSSGRRLIVTPPTAVLEFNVINI